MPAKQRVSIEIKALQEDGSFEGVLASYNTVDLGGDRILPGAFTKTIQERGSEVPLLWQHKTDQPIGTLTLVDEPDALKIKGQLVMELDQAKRAYILLKAKVIKGMSIGFDTIKDSVDNGVRQLKELRLWEGSLVTFPMNEACMVTSVKSLGGGETKDDFNTELAELQLQDAGYQIICALSYALYSVNWATGVSKADKVTAVETILEQFSAAYLAYFPQYIDWQSAEYGDMEMMGRLKMEQKDFSAMLSRGAKTLAGIRKLKAGVQVGELKEGRKFSADSMKTLSEAHDHVKGLSDIFDALFDDPADDEDEEDKSAATGEVKAASETKTEPVEDHSAAAEILTGLRSLIPKA